MSQDPENGKSSSFSFCENCGDILRCKKCGEIVGCPKCVLTLCQICDGLHMAPACPILKLKCETCKSPMILVDYSSMHSFFSPGGYMMCTRAGCEYGLTMDEAKQIIYPPMNDEDYDDEDDDDDNDDDDDADG